jgi:tetratricopeptide (TPR) repeat protein
VHHANVSGQNSLHHGNHLGGAGGYGNHHHHNHGFWNNNSFFFGFGSPFFGYFWYPWLNNGYGGYGGYGYGGGYGYYPWGSYGSGYGYPYGYCYQAAVGYNAGTVAADDPNAPQPQPPSADQLSNSIDFAGEGEADFKAGRYSSAVQNWRHALVDDPRNGAIVLLLSQALFQIGQYDEAAGAAQQAMRMLPQDKWGAVVSNYKELYGNIQDYTDQLKLVEKARDAKPTDPGLHFLLGYHFGFLGFPKQAVKELDKTLEIVPKDEIAQKLRETFQAQLKDQAPATPPAPADEKPADAKSGAEKGA